MTKSLTDFSVLTFDCYGTLIDWESGIWDALQPLLQANGCATVTRARALETYSALEHAQQGATPGMAYPALLSAVHTAFAARLDLETTAALDQAFRDTLDGRPGAG